MTVVGERMIDDNNNNNNKTNFKRKNALDEPEYNNNNSNNVTLIYIAFVFTAAAREKISYFVWSLKSNTLMHFNFTTEFLCSFGPDNTYTRWNRIVYGLFTDILSRSLVF